MRTPGRPDLADERIIPLPVETERAAAHQAWLAGVKVTVLLAPAPRARG